MYYFVRTPALLEWWYSDYVWSLPNPDNRIYLTFDDGCKPELTPFLLKTLSDYGAKATFFMVGANAQKYPSLVQEIIAEGHHIGNHTQQHLNGWKTAPAAYLEDVARCAEFVPSTLFRPPYGRMTRAQAKALAGDYELIMWSLLPGDFDPKTTAALCLQRLEQKTCSGDIIVLHDNLKFEQKIRTILDPLLAFYQSKSFSLAPIPYRERLNLKK